MKIRIELDASQVVALAGAIAAGSASATDRVVEGVRVAGDLTADFIRSNAPRRTGTLAGNVTVSGGGLEVEVHTSTDRNYEFYQEFGTSKMAPQPSFFPGADVGEEVLAEEISDAGALW